MSATIKDSDDTVFALDEVVVAAMLKWHRAEPWSGVQWQMGRDPEDAHYSHIPSNVTVIALAIDVFKALVRKRVPTAYARIESGCYEIRKSHYLAHPRITFGHPTEFQAWHAAYKEIKS